LPIGACRLLSDTDTAGDPIAGSIGPDCELPFEAPADDEQWWIISNEPTNADELIVLIYGQGNRASAVTIHTDLSATGLICGMVDSEVQFALNGREFTIQAASQKPETCAIDMRGTIIDCGAPLPAQPSDIAFEVVADGSLIVDGRERAFGALQFIRRPASAPSGVIDLVDGIEDPSVGE
jgi:hypothetical protein